MAHTVNIIFESSTRKLFTQHEMIYFSSGYILMFWKEGVNRRHLLQGGIWAQKVTLERAARSLKGHFFSPDSLAKGIFLAKVP